MRKITTFIKLCLAVRDVWDTMDSSGKARSGLFKDFCEWTMEAHASSQETPLAVKELLSFVTDTKEYDDYSVPDILAKLSINAHGQYYRVVAAVDTKHNQEDRRVRDVIEHTIKHKFSLSHSDLVCPFFTDIGFLRTRPKTRSNYAYCTEPCTRFEQLIFISCIIDLTRTLQSTRAAKKRKISKERSDSVPPLSSLKTLKGENASRVGAAVQHVVRAWDVFAFGFGFEDLEEMIAPYIQLCPDNLQYRVINNRSDGYVPKSQAVRFNPSQPLTSKKEETFDYVCERSASLDANLRKIGTEFFQDVQGMTNAEELYSLPPDKKWHGFAKFNIPDGGYPERFSDLPLSLTEAIRTDLRPERRMQTTQPISQRRRAKAISVVPTVEEKVASRPQRSAAETPLAPFAKEYPTKVPRSISDRELQENMEKLRTALKPYLRMYEASFEDILEMEDLDAPTCPLTTSNAQLLLCDPPYNTRRDSEKKNSSHDYLSTKDMDSFVSMAAVILRQGGHGIIFCSFQQFASWSAKLKAATTSLERNRTGPTFAVDLAPLIVERHPSVNTTPPGKKCSLANSVEYAVHFKKNGLSYKKEEAMVNYKAFNYVRSTFPAFKNVINNVMWLLPGEQLRAVNSSDPTKTFPLRSEQKPIALLKELICRFSQPGDVVVDLFSGTFSTAHACMTLPQHRKFIGCELDGACYAVASDHVLRRTASAICTRTTNINLPSQFTSLLTTIDKHYALQGMTDPNWKAPSGMPQYQCFPDHIMCHLASIWNDPGFLLYRNKPCHDWPRSYQGLLEQIDAKQVLHLDAVVNGLLLSISTIKHRSAGQGVYASRTFHKGDIICQYYGTLVYHDLSARKQISKMYGGGALGVNAGRYREYALQVHVEGSNFSAVKDVLDGRKAICVVPAAFCVGAFFNDARYHPQDEEYDAFCENRLSSPRVQNAKLVTMGSQTHPNDLINVSLIVVKAMTLISPGSEIFVNYNSDGFVYETAG